MEEWRRKYPEKFVPEEEIFRRIRRGSRIFVGTGCGEPQHLLTSFVKWVEAHPKALFGAEIFQVWSLGVSAYTEPKFKDNFRANTFFVGPNTRKAVNEGEADYTPIFLSQVPRLLREGMVPLDVALIQTSPPDSHGYLSLGISVDITKAAVESADMVVAQVNRYMPRIHGDGFLHLEEVDFLVPWDEPLLEYEEEVPDELAQRIGKYVARLVEDGDTIQVGYGSIPNAILSNLMDKRNLGIHSELFTDGMVELMKAGVVDNSKKRVDRGKAVASFCMGKRSTYEFLNDNPMVEFRTVDYTNDPIVIARQHHMVAINSALEIDLTGQATAESIGGFFYSGLGGQADFMRGAALARHGKPILVLQSTAEKGTVSRIVPRLKEGAGVTLNRGDVHYVVTEYGVAYLHGKSIRERAMELIRLAHPHFRPWLIEEARRLGLIFKDQLYVSGEYPEDLETFKKTKTGLEIFLRPIKLSDEPLLKEFFYSLSDESLYRRFVSLRKDMPHDLLQKFVAVDYKKQMVLLAILKRGEKEEVVGMAQYVLDEATNFAEVAFAVKDQYQNQGIGRELLKQLTYIAKRRGIFGFTAQVLATNRPMLRLFDSMNFSVEKRVAEGMVELKMRFRRS
ncbi:MAG: GNAT family N-acetyltransferase [Candidatus Hadarchaeales archaeon]